MLQEEIQLRDEELAAVQEEKKKLELETEVQKKALKGQSEDAAEKEMLLKAEIEKRELLLAALEQNAGECCMHFCSLCCTSLRLSHVLAPARSMLLLSALCCFYPLCVACICPVLPLSALCSCAVSVCPVFPLLACTLWLVMHFSYSNLCYSSC